MTRASPVIALTALAMRGEEERGRACCCEGYLPLPIGVDTLFTKITHRLT